MPVMKMLRRTMAVVALTALSGCASNTTPVPPCCYEGAVTTARLGDLDVRTADGRTMKAVDGLPGFTPDLRLFSLTLPFSEVESQDVIYASLIPLIAIYDANGNTVLEQPEIIVLHVLEAMRATGVEARHLESDSPVWALSAPNADVGGLMNWIRTHRDSMSEEGQLIFRDLELLGQDLRTRGKENGDDGAEIWI